MQHVLLEQLFERVHVEEQLHEPLYVVVVLFEVAAVERLDELFEVLTWRQLGLHEKSVFLLNIEGYWQPLIDLLEHVIKQGFADENLRSYFQVVDTVDDFATALRDALS